MTYKKKSNIIFIALLFWIDICMCILLIQTQQTVEAKMYMSPIIIVWCLIGLIICMLLLSGVLLD